MCVFFSCYCCLWCQSCFASCQQLKRKSFKAHKLRHTYTYICSHTHTPSKQNGVHTHIQLLCRLGTCFDFVLCLWWWMRFRFNWVYNAWKCLAEFQRICHTVAFVGSCFDWLTNCEAKFYYTQPAKCVVGGIYNFFSFLWK